jgi:hypothetical protein
MDKVRKPSNSQIDLRSRGDRFESRTQYRLSWMIFLDHPKTFPANPPRPYPPSSLQFREHNEQHKAEVFLRSRFPSFRETKCSLPWSQNRGTGPSPKTYYASYQTIYELCEQFNLFYKNLTLLTPRRLEAGERVARPGTGYRRAVTAISDFLNKLQE